MCEIKSFMQLVQLLDMLQEIVSVAVQNVHNMGSIVKEPHKNGTVGSSYSNGNDPYKQFVSLFVLCVFHESALLIGFIFLICPV